MSIIVFLIVGGLVGWAASALMGRDEGILASILIGIVGSFIGGFLSVLFTGSNQSYLTLNWVNLFWAFIGSVVLVAIMNALQSRSYGAHRGV